MKIASWATCEFYEAMPLIEMDLLKYCYEEILKGIDQKVQSENAAKAEVTNEVDRRNRKVSGTQWTIQDYRKQKNLSKTIGSHFKTWVRWAILLVAFGWNFPYIWNYLTGEVAPVEKKFLSIVKTKKGAFEKGLKNMKKTYI